MIQVLDSKVRVARKQHQCNFCYGMIFKKESYVNEKSVGDEGICSWKMHNDCEALATKLDMYKRLGDIDFGLTADMFQDDVIEFYDEYVPDPTFKKEGAWNPSFNYKLRMTIHFIKHIL